MKDFSMELIWAKIQMAAAMIEGPLSASCPASALQLHRKVTVVLDQAAAGDAV